jgi:hypothetical protein
MRQEARGKRQEARGKRQEQARNQQAKSYSLLASLYRSLLALLCSLFLPLCPLVTMLLAFTALCSFVLCSVILSRYSIASRFSDAPRFFADILRSRSYCSSLRFLFFVNAPCFYSVPRLSTIRLRLCDGCDECLVAEAIQKKLV